MQLEFVKKVIDDDKEQHEELHQIYLAFVARVAPPQESGSSEIDKRAEPGSKNQCNDTDMDGDMDNGEK